MKKVKFFLFSIFCLFVAVLDVSASNISSINMDIEIDKNGTAVVTETWNASVNQGTEGWHPYYNIGKSSIRVIEASMDGESYEVVEKWNENASVSAKAYKAGTYKVDSKELDVVFGISSYGTHTYQIVYEITNFVSNISDADIVYWQLFPYDFSTAPGNVTIKISGPYYYPDSLDVWGFGMKGAPCYVKDGSIYMTSDGKISKKEYLTLLAKFPKGTFETSSELDNNFDYYLKLAQDGSKTSKGAPLLGVFAILIMFIPSIIQVAVWVLIVTIVVRGITKKKQNYLFGNAGNVLPSDKDINNFRDIPCNKDIYRAFWVADTYGLNKSKNDFFGVLLLKWIYNGNVIVNTLEKKKLIINSKEDVIVFDHIPEDVNQHEKDLYGYMLEASGDNVLEKNEFKKWCKKHYSKILDWSDKVLRYERDELVKEGKIKVITNEKGLLFKYNVNSYLIDDSMKEEAIQMKGLKKFLIEFSQIDKKEPIEVKLWNEYLMYAQIFGISERVMDKFKKLYPEVIEDMGNYNFDYTTFMFVNNISHAGVSAASAARSAAQSYSGGGGGFSSGGGGGGSFGGGGGGGGFR